MQLERMTTAARRLFVRQSEAAVPAPANAESLIDLSAVPCSRKASSV